MIPPVRHSSPVRRLFDKKGTSAMAETSYNLQMNRLAVMALNAFPPEDQRRIRSALGHLIGPMALDKLGSRVRRLSTDEPLYSLRVPPDFRIFFSHQGDLVTIRDILRQGTIEAFAASSAPEVPVDEPSEQTETHRGSRGGHRKVSQRASRRR
jgi:hypothetical protein